MVTKWKFTPLALGLGLLFSLLTASTLFASSQLANKGINAPASQCLLYYLFLALINGGIILYRKRETHLRETLKEKLHYYIKLALLDVLVNFFVIEAIQHTSLTSVMLLDNWTITCSMLFALLFLKENFGVQILVGLAICVASYATVFISDVHSVDETSSVVNLLTGDMLIIIGATLSGVSMVSQVLFFKKDDRVIRNVFLGIFGAILTAPQIAISERSEFRFILFSPVAMCLVIGFSLSKFFLNLGTYLFYKIDGSTMLVLNLSIIITSNIWVILIRTFAYHEKVDWIYFVSMVATTLGLGLIVFPGGYDIEIDSNHGDEPPIDELCRSDKRAKFRIINFLDKISY